MAAQMAVGTFKDTDFRIATYSVELLNRLPAPAYPWDVNMALAAEGRELYAKNCAACHRPNNGAAYDIGTDMSRTQVIRPGGGLAASNLYATICANSSPLEVGGEEIWPCREFEGVSLEGQERFIVIEGEANGPGDAGEGVVRKPPNGYNALPLDGIWAQAPYLHNGSIPTLYHLLIPDSRPDTFRRSTLDYDRKMVGYAWRPDKDAKEGYLWDTTLMSALSNAGHDKNVTDPETQATYQLDWSEDIVGAMALIEYMKTF
jgi:hypothetical protein